MAINISMSLMLLTGSEDVQREKAMEAEELPGTVYLGPRFRRIRRYAEHYVTIDEVTSLH